MKDYHTADVVPCDPCLESLRGGVVGGAGGAGVGARRGFSHTFIKMSKASFKAMRSIVKELLSPGCRPPPSAIVFTSSSSLLAIILHPVELQPLNLHPPSDCRKMFGQ